MTRAAPASSARWAASMLRMPPDTWRGIEPAARWQRSMTLAQRALAGSFQIDNVNQRRLGGDDARHELLEGLAKDDALVIALFQANGVVAEEVEGGDNLHGSEVA